MPITQENIKALENQGENSKYNQNEIKRVIELYMLRKIERFNTARNIIKGLISRNILGRNKALNKLKFYEEEYIPRSDPKRKQLPKGTNRFIKPKTETIIEITGKILI